MVVSTQAAQAEGAPAPSPAGDFATAWKEFGGVPTRLATQLKRLGINHPRDLLFHLPYRYQDRTHITRIANLQVGKEALVLGQIEQVHLNYAGRRSLSVRIADFALGSTDPTNRTTNLTATSASLTLRFFHFREAQHRAFRAAVSPYGLTSKGGWIKCYGEIRRARNGQLEIAHPEYRLYPERPQDIAEKTLTPVYPVTTGLGSATLSKLIQRALTTQLTDLPEFLPPDLREKFNLLPLAEALKFVHQPPPKTDTDTLLAGTHPTQQRLALEELLAHHLALARLREKHRTRTAPAFPAPPAVRDNWQHLKTQLGFTLTNAQQRVTREILQDLQTETPALRLLQGDVGSGKTVVAAAAALRAIDAGYQAALMAPTELLSEQHRKTFSAWFAKLNFSNKNEIGESAAAVEWLAGKMPAAARKRALARIQNGEARLIIGTHALFQQQVKFHKLGLLIIDEQHRFGVDQRLALRNKAESGEATPTTTPDAPHSPPPAPHQLIMSATPIPRSLAMIFYADLDVSRLDELPPTRRPVQTVVLPNTRRGEVAARVRAVCRAKPQGQAYWVCPLIDESENLQAQAATETYAALQKLFSDIRVALIHGRMKTDEKEEVMRRFHRGEVDLLVATTVIEVGVDVPRASLMVIENAERLGLAQLHQLRGRVGRGARQSTCVLMYQPPLGQNARTRLATLRNTNDGFKIAEQDLRQRGAGELLGTRQTGLQQMHIADLARDHALLPRIEPIARHLNAHHPQAARAIIQRWLSRRESYGEV